MTELSVLAGPEAASLERQSLRWYIDVRMITLDRPSESREAARNELAHQAAWLDWALALTSSLMIVGAILDAWAHDNIPQLETFFTPWHGVLYSGMLASSIVLLVALVRGRLAGRGWRQTLPVGYGLSLVGVLLFALGGLGDMTWHLLFGIEDDFEALISPTHLLLAVGGALIVGGPLRAAWSRPERSARSGLIGWLPTLLSLTLTLSLLMFFTDYANPFTRPWLVGSRLFFTPEPTHGQAFGRGQGEMEQGAGATAILLYAGMLTGLVLLAIRRWELPTGSLTLLFTLTIGLSLVPHGQFRFIPVALAGGIAGDVLHGLLRPGVERRGALRVFAFAVPSILFALYFVALALTEGVAWVVHVWAGSIFLAGIVGLLVSYLAVPPPTPQPAA